MNKRSKNVERESRNKTKNELYTNSNIATSPATTTTTTTKATKTKMICVLKLDACLVYAACVYARILCYVLNWFFFCCCLLLVSFSFPLSFPSYSFFSAHSLNTQIEFQFHRADRFHRFTVVMRQHHVHIYIIFVLLYCTRWSVHLLICPYPKKFLLNFCKVQLPVVCWQTDSIDRVFWKKKDKQADATLSCFRHFKVDNRE